MEFCRQRLSSFKRPRYVAFVDELPRTSTGKLLKRVLREQYGEARNS
jgi:fatty-acyl-CoA synthase